MRTEEETKIIEAMAFYGGRFVEALSVCFTLADHEQFEKLKRTFIDCWLKYEKIVKTKKT